MSFCTAEPHVLRRSRNKNRVHKYIFETISMQLYRDASSSVLILRQSRKDVFLCGEAACTNAVAAQPQQKNA
jgi:hypothetical protein